MKTLYRVLAVAFFLGTFLAAVVGLSILFGMGEADRVWGLAALAVCGICYFAGEEADRRALKG